MKGSSVAGNGRRRLLADPYHGSLCRAKQTGSDKTTNSAKISDVPLQERLVCALSAPPLGTDTRFRAHWRLGGLIKSRGQEGGVALKVR